MKGAVANHVTRTIREVLRNDKAMFDAYMRNPHFHAVVDTACQQATALGAITVLMNGMLTLARENDMLLVTQAVDHAGD